MIVKNKKCKEGRAWSLRWMKKLNHYHWSNRLFRIVG
jgi:hypothetical protein